MQTNLNTEQRSVNEYMNGKTDLSLRKVTFICTCNILFFDNVPLFVNLLSDKYSFGHVLYRFNIEDFGQSSFKYVKIIVESIALSLKDFIIQIKSNR